MLFRLTINNVAVIEHAEVDFIDGLNVLTGETGAGKSIVIDSINAILGERTSRDIVRSGADKASIYAEFTDIGPSVFDILKENDVDIDDDAILLQRIITADGKSSARINGIPVSASVLRMVGNELITVCGQHDSQKLLQKSSHLTYIDALADLSDSLNEYALLYNEYKSIQSQLDGLQINESEKQQRLDFLSYQLKEIEEADIKVGERDQLLAERKIIRNRESIISSLNKVLSMTNGNEDSAGIKDMLYDLSDCLSDLSEYSKTFETYRNAVDEFKFVLDECSNDSSGELMSFEFQDSSLDDIESRLDAIYRISKKYGETEEDILRTYENLKAKYDSIQTSDRLIEELSKKLDQKYKEVFNTAIDLSKKRKSAAKAFETDVLNELEYLDMKGSDFKVEFTETEPGPTGIDSVEFFISPNRGQELKPLNKIASGGELSRIMLAIRCILSGKETIDTMIFDEIDTGVSGVAAGKIASKLRQLSQVKQVICVTHLPQIAAGADNHLFIEKISESTNTYTRIHKLDKEKSAYEIARIISGNNITETVLESAKEMISIAKSNNERI